MGLCAFVANIVQYFQSYGAVLAGYTASIVGLLVFGHQDHIYEVAKARLTCVSLGIFITVIVSSLFSKSRAKEDLFARMRNSITMRLRRIHNMIAALLSFMSAARAFDLLLEKRADFLPIFESRLKTISLLSREITSRQDLAQDLPHQNLLPTMSFFWGRQTHPFLTSEDFSIWQWDFLPQLC